MPVHVHTLRSMKGVDGVEKHNITYLAYDLWRARGILRCLMEFLPCR